MPNKFIKKNIQKIFQSLGFDIMKRKKFPLHMDVVWLRKLLYFKQIFDRISSLEGDIVECGVERGMTFFFLAFLMSEEGGKRKLWGFDSFEGFPEPTVEDDSFRNPKKGELGGVNPEDILNVLRVGSINEDFIKNNVKIVKGFFAETLRSYQGNQIALLHIDADLYQSYKCVLEELFPKVIKGGVILFDEYDNPKFPGAKKAVDEYFQNTSYRISYDKKSDKHYIFKSA